MQGLKLATGAIVLAFVPLLMGCGGGPATFPVSGKVVIEGAGPLSIGEIIFTSDKSTSRGAIQKDGTFRLRTTDVTGEAEGALAGKYKVYIVGAVQYEDPTSLSSPSKMLIDPKYSDYNTSGLEYTVEAKPNSFEIPVTAPKG